MLIYGLDGVLVYGMGCKYTGWDVSIWDGVLVYWIGYRYLGCC